MEAVWTFMCDDGCTSLATTVALRLTRLVAALDVRCKAGGPRDERCRLRAGWMGMACEFGCVYIYKQDVLERE